MKKTIPFIFAMGFTILISNILLQYFFFENLLTYAALTYPIAFLITDLANRVHGRKKARMIILWGFAIGIVCTFFFWEINQVTFRIAVASGSAFLVAQIFDVQVFGMLRHLEWWKAPVISSFIGSVIDTAIFFFISFSQFTFDVVSETIFADSNYWAFEVMPLLKIGPEMPTWVSMAAADFLVKILMAIVLLMPYRLLVRRNAHKKVLCVK